LTRFLFWAGIAIALIVCMIRYIDGYV